MRGNSGGNLMDYWTAFNNYTRLQGGFLFSWADQGLCMTNSREDVFWGGFGQYGGEICQTTTDPTYSRWGHNPPGQASSLGLYPETPLLQLAQRNSIKGRMNDVQYTPFTNGVRQGTTPYPYVRYGSKRRGAAASVLTAGGLTWPDRGIQDKAVFEAHHPANRVAAAASASAASPSSASASSDNDKLLPHFHHSDMYGLCPPPLYHKSFYKLLFTTALSDDSLILSQAVAKPQLLEAKYCMSPFDCFIEKVTVTESPIAPVILNRYNHVTATFEPMGPVPPSNCSFAQLKVSTKMNIMNLLDHVDDITENLTFDALLLCNGLVVCASTLRAQASALVHRTYNEETGRPTFQELEALGDFEVPMTLVTASSAGGSAGKTNKAAAGDKKGGSRGGGGCGSNKVEEQEESLVTKTVCGIKCPEDILLVPYCKNDINDSIKKASQEYKDALSESQDKTSNKKQIELLHDGHRSTRSVSVETEQSLFKSDEYLSTTVSCTGCLWSVVIIGRTSKHTAWAPQGYPLGMKQCKISNQFFRLAKYPAPTPAAPPTVAPELVIHPDPNPNRSNYSSHYF